MPELPEVEAVCRKLRREAMGARITEANIQRRRITSPQDPAEAESLASGTIDRIDRRAKNIRIRLSSGLTMHVHLRMTGNLYVIPDHRLRPLATSAWFTFEDGRALLFEDTRGLGTLQVRADDDDAGLGPEPLSRAFTPDVLIRTARASKQPAKLFLLDQRRIAGLGNIYAAEALHAARINPKRAISRNNEAKLRALHAAIVRILRDAVRSACIAYSRPGRFREAEGFSPAVYDREGEACLGCGRPIRRITQGGRSTYYCPHCQR